MATTGKTSTEERALALLGTGLGPEVVAAAIGVSVGRISQLMSEPEFAESVTALRYENLQKHNVRDCTYDELEDTALEQLKNNLPLIQRPMELLKTIQVLNAAKRRGQSTPDAIINQTTIVNLTMPTKIVNKFTTNINNQVIQAGTQELLTIQSSELTKLSSARTVKELPNGLQRQGTADSTATEVTAGTANEEK